MPVSMISDMHPHLSTHTSMSFNWAARIDTGSRSQERPAPVHLTGPTAGWHQREQINSASNAMAGHVRAIDARLQAIERYASKMIGDIRTFEKNFPPFPRGSEERVRLLNSFSAIRKQIARLTIPPEKEIVPTVLGQIAPQADSSNTLIERFEQLLQSVGAGLPGIPNETSDATFKDLGENLENLLCFISQNRAGLANRAMPRKHFQEDSDTDVYVQIEAFDVTISRIFSGQSGWQMTVSQTQLKAIQV